VFAVCLEAQKVVQLLSWPSSAFFIIRPLLGTL